MEMLFLFLYRLWNECTVFVLFVLGRQTRRSLRLALLTDSLEACIEGLREKNEEMTARMQKATEDSLLSEKIERLQQATKDAFLSIAHVRDALTRMSGGIVAHTRAYRDVDRVWKASNFMLDGAAQGIQEALDKYVDFLNKNFLDMKDGRSWGKFERLTYVVGVRDKHRQASDFVRQFRYMNLGEVLAYLVQREYEVLCYQRACLRRCNTEKNIEGGE